MRAIVVADRKRQERRIAKRTAHSRNAVSRPACRLQSTLRLQPRTRWDASSVPMEVAKNVGRVSRQTCCASIPSRRMRTSESSSCEQRLQERGHDVGKNLQCVDRSRSERGILRSQIRQQRCDAGPVADAHECGDNGLADAGHGSISSAAASGATASCLLPKRALRAIACPYPGCAGRRDARRRSFTRLRSRVSRLINGIGPPFDNCSGDLIDRSDGFGAAGGHKFSRHAPDHRGRFRFSDGTSAFCLQSGHCVSAIASHPGHENADQPLRVALFHGRIDHSLHTRMPGIIGFGRGRHCEGSSRPAGHNHICVAASDVDRAGSQHDRPCHFDNIQSAMTIRRFANGPVNFAGMCWATRTGQGTPDGN